MAKNGFLEFTIIVLFAMLRLVLNVFKKKSYLTSLHFNCLFKPTFTATLSLASQRVSLSKAYAKYFMHMQTSFGVNQMKKVFKINLI